MRFSPHNVLKRIIISRYNRRSI